MVIADNAFCKWLGTTPHKHPDTIPQPSKVLESHLNRNKQKKWNAKIKKQVIPYMDASGEKLSPSMRQAMSDFLNLPCAQVKA